MWFHHIVNLQIQKWCTDPASPDSCFSVLTGSTFAHRLPALKASQYMTAAAMNTFPTHTRHIWFVFSQICSLIASFQHAPDALEIVIQYFLYKKFTICLLIVEWPLFVNDVAMKFAYFRWLSGVLESPMQSSLSIFILNYYKVQYSCFIIAVAKLHSEQPHSNISYSWISFSLGGHRALRKPLLYSSFISVAQTVGWICSQCALLEDPAEIREWQILRFCLRIPWVRYSRRVR